jgi:signal transduction histidine kinase
VQRHEDGLLQVWSDPEKLHQVLVNLLSNAYKFSPEGGSIELRSRRARRDGTPVALIEIQDQGIGMDPAALAHVFERFFRADKSGHIPGTGLGLSLVKQIVELSGGQIHLESQPGQGTRVEITLPLAADAPDPATDTPA